MGNCTDVVFITFVIDISLFITIQGGWGLAFVVYPSAMSLFGVPGGQFFATCFWVMILCLGIDSAFALIESVICACCDRFEYFARHRWVSINLIRRYLFISVCVFNS